MTDHRTGLIRAEFEGHHIVAGRVARGSLAEAGWLVVHYGGHLRKVGR